MRRAGPVFALYIAVCLSACRGSGTVIERHEGSLDGHDERLRTIDGSYYDDYRFWTRAGHQITIELRSTEFDPYVHLFDARRNQLAYNDDFKPGERTARIDFEAPYEGHYYVLANSRDAGETGAYRLEIRAEPK